MPRTLHVLRFQPEYLWATRDFSCGDEEWEREVAEWIRGGPEGVLDDIRDFGTEVWLYLLPGEGLVGFGSLGRSNWPWPEPTARRGPINIVPWVGIERRYQGEPRGPGEVRFFDQIMSHLMAEAVAHTERQPALGLYVDQRNVRAIRAYAHIGFRPWSLRRPHPTTPQVFYRSYVLDLSSFEGQP